MRVIDVNEIKERLDAYLDENGVENISAEEAAAIREIVSVCDDETLGKTVKVIDIENIYEVLELYMKSHRIKKYSSEFISELAGIVGVLSSASFEIDFE